MKTAVVTGGGSGIGAALCVELSRLGARVVVTDVDGVAAEGTASALAHASGHRLDVTDAAAVEALAADVMARHERVDLWINNAGIAVGGATEDLELADWKRVLDVNLAGVINGIHAIYPRMLHQRAGQIVNIASVAGLAPYPFALPYVATKRAVVGLSLALRAEARGRGVRVSVACPGRISTPIWTRSTVRGSLAASRDKLFSRFAPGMTADECARKIMRGVRRDRAVIPVTTEAHVAWWIERLSPALAAWVSHRAATLARSMMG